jgi:ATP adenylyltransferase
VNLPDAIEHATRRALAAGALHSIATTVRCVEDAGVGFVLRTASSLARKDAAARAPGPADPLGDFDPDLFVRDLGAAHYLLLNKFNLVAGHVLIVTRRFQPQEALLDDGDFEALAACLREIDGLGFYNGGAEAGASQARKHLQLMPLPLAPECTQAQAVPIEPALREDGSGLPFPHAFARLSADVSAAEMAAAYRRLLARVGISGRAGAQGEMQTAPYNLLVRRRWMLVVPRARACFEAIPVNALGFAGSLFVRTAADLARACEVGPMRMLQGVAA